MKLETIQRKKLTVFLLVAFLLPWLLGVLMGYGFFKGTDVSAFPNAQMFYPAAGIMLAILLFEEEREQVPERFFKCFLAVTAMMVMTALLSLFMEAQKVLLAMNLFIITGSVIAWIFLLAEKKGKRTRYGLRWNRTAASIAMIVLFLVLYFARVAISMVINGGTDQLSMLFGDPLFWVQWGAVLFLNFFLSFLPFLGEEYGWRYYFTPFLQSHFGKVKGVLILGVLWGLWHLPINVFYYSPQTWLQSILAQQITCIALGIFFAYAYEKTKNIWVVTVLHFLNNNLIAVLNGGGPDVLSNQIITWKDLGWALVINGAVFLPFLLTKEFKDDKRS